MCIAKRENHLSGAVQSLFLCLKLIIDNKLVSRNGTKSLFQDNNREKNYHEISASKGCTGDWAFQRADGGLIIFE